MVGPPVAELGLSAKMREVECTSRMSRKQLRDVLGETCQCGMKLTVQTSTGQPVLRGLES